jgi:hypothetical protein
MDGRNEQRVAIKFRSKVGLSATETLVLVVKTYGNEALNQSNVFSWYYQFRDRREVVKDAYDSETMQQSSQWVGETSPRPKKPKFQRSRIKTMLIIFFDSQGIVHKEIIPEGKTVNAEFYKGVMDRLLKRIQ